MNSVARLATLTLRRQIPLNVPRRTLFGVKSGEKVYNMPVRVVNMDDLMEPYGSYKVAYAAEKKRAIYYVIRGIVCLSISLTIFYQSGTMDGLWMPNLDNIMEDTEPFNLDTEGRVSV